MVMLVLCQTYLTDVALLAFTSVPCSTSLFTTSNWPVCAAQESAVWPSSSKMVMLVLCQMYLTDFALLVSTSAPCSTSHFTTSHWPACTAYESAIWPCWSKMVMLVLRQMYLTDFAPLVSMSAPCLTSHSTTSHWPACTAYESAVWPHWSKMVMLAPSSVYPVYSTPLVFTLACCLIRNSTTSNLPKIVATITDWSVTNVQLTPLLMDCSISHLLLHYWPPASRNIQPSQDSLLSRRPEASFQVVLVVVQEMFRSSHEVGPEVTEAQESDRMSIPRPLPPKGVHSSWSSLRCPQSKRR